MQFRQDSEKMMEFINKSPSPYHVIDNIRQELTQAGFCELYENCRWELEFKKSYFVVRNDSAVIAFTTGEENVHGFNIVAAHCDSPCFKIKNNPENLSSGYITLNTERYGGMIMSAWLDRPLSVAGRVITENNGELKTHLVNIDRDLLIIPNLAIHMNREVNKGYEYNPAKDMMPLFAARMEQGQNNSSQTNNDISEKDSFNYLVATQAGVDASEILAMDLFVYNRMKGTFIGMDSEFIASPKLDDLQCVYAEITALKETGTSSRTNMCCIFDNEEVGSRSLQGADSDFLSVVTERIYNSLGYDREDYLTALADSFMISADNAHGVHPNHPQMADSSNKPYLNGGIVIKNNGEQRYTTDAYSQARMISLCKKADVPYQTYANRSDIPGGSTLGNISISQISVHMADIGLAQLAMHSPCETAGKKDTSYMIELIKTFFES